MFFIVKENNYDELENCLKPLGFVQSKGLGMFSHEMIGCEFDFSACSAPGAMKILFEKAAQMGAESAREQMRQALGM